MLAVSMVRSVRLLLSSFGSSDTVAFALQRLTVFEIVWPCGIRPPHISHISHLSPDLQSRGSSHLACSSVAGEYFGDSVLILSWQLWDFH